MTTLQIFLTRERHLLVERWLALVIDTYPTAMAALVRGEADPFRNPVGQILREGLGGLADQLLGEFDEEKVGALLDPVVRMRAVQGFSSAEAVEFVFGLKRIVRELLTVVRGTPSLTPELDLLDERIDRTALVACELFGRVKGRISAIRARERSRRDFVAARAAGHAAAAVAEPAGAATTPSVVGGSVT
jgi:hypothetical protein